MTEEQKATLRAMAEDAKRQPGEWWDAETLRLDYDVPGRDAFYIAAAHPAAVLALLDENARLRNSLRVRRSSACNSSTAPSCWR